MGVRKQITEALKDLINSKLNGINYPTNVYNKTEIGLVFWDEINNFPHISVVRGPTSVDYLPSEFKWFFTTFRIRVFTKGRTSEDELDDIMDQLETMLDANNTLAYDSLDPTKTTEEISVISIVSDEGLLAHNKMSMGEMTIQIRYDNR